MKFKRIIKHSNEGQSFDLEESTIKAGEKYVYYDRIQEARTDTEILPTLQKYGCLTPMEVNKEQMYLDLRALQKTDARSLKEFTMKADELWNKLPHEIKDKFENNRDIFMKDGEKWLKNEIEKVNNQPAPAEQPSEQTKGE